MIKMRTSITPNAQCCECGNGRNNSLELFDICICGHILTICDQCNEQLFRKTLVADQKVSGRVKSQKDMAVIRKRKERR